jgi:hypothetical protein
MKKMKILFLASVTLCLTFIVISVDSKDNLVFINTSKATQQTYQATLAQCYTNGEPDGYAVICIAGTYASCTPGPCY